MVTRFEEKDPKKRILSVCVKMFIERGFKKTTMLDIIKEADVSAGTFQNIFKTKDGVLVELFEFMFNNQFDLAYQLSSKTPSLPFIYGIETAIQLTITELNENIRDVYIEAYTQPTLSELRYQKTSSELCKIFKTYNPSWQESDFYEAEVGTSGMMRSFMLKPCDKYFTLNKKIERFLSMSFNIYHVNKDEQEKIISYITSLDLVSISNKVLKKLFAMLEMTFDFKFSTENEIKIRG